MNQFYYEIIYIKEACKASVSEEKLINFNQKIGRAIKIARKSVGLSQTKLADKVNFCRNNIVQIEAGARSKPIPLKTIYKILKPLNMSLEVFLDIAGLLKK